MRWPILLIAAALPLIAFTAEDANAQRRFAQPGIHGGGFRPAGVRPGGQFRPARARPGRWQTSTWQGRPGWRGPARAYPRRWARPVYSPRGWGRPVVYRRGWGRPVVYGRGNPWGWGWGSPGWGTWGGGYWGGGYWGGRPWGWGLAGLGTGVAIGAAVQPAPVFATPIRSAIGGLCATPPRTCALINPAPIGTGCSCRVPGGRARGSVVGP